MTQTIDSAVWEYHIEYSDAYMKPSDMFDTNYLLTTGKLRWSSFNPSR